MPRGRHRADFGDHRKFVRTWQLMPKEALFSVEVYADILKAYTDQHDKEVRLEITLPLEARGANTLNRVRRAQKKPGTRKGRAPRYPMGPKRKGTK